jgi:toxin-antitoxin system PIN domain toxin
LSFAVDTNLLLYSSDRRSPLQPRAAEFVRECATGSELTYLFWPVLIGYLRIATHPGIFDNPLSPREAATNLDRLLRRPHVRSPGEADGFWDAYRATTDDLVVRGDLVSDAYLVALMRQYGVRTIYSRDRDFAKFRGIDVRDPFL